ncbi:Serine protease, subtilisin family [Lentzea xinjiangensis]|uniref:Serine protease, subtilisin family n=1 Tax=Lentzea xinjiangensis TaxID=402600 RepID=A0A1H9VUS2_9PSEU|nr:S8 family peptidase [Lentzea xinjiangensis]SES25342.1 Serine protease, subtilisin family [Lentzea xinjiangensis]
MRLLGVVVLAGALLTAGGAQAAPARAAAPAPTITLITGDQVLTGHRAVRPAPGREHVVFTTYTAGGHEYVVPGDAMPMIAEGRLDERLFDVTELATYGGALPVIATYPEGTVSAQSGLPLRSINGVAFDAAKTPLAGGLATTSAARIWLDARRRVSLDRSVAQINAPAAHAAGLTGKDVTVAVLDTGVDHTHPDLADREIAERNFTTSPDNGDHHGHGTHVASIIAGTGARSGGKYRGVAPDARILDVKVLGDNGSGQDSGIIAGMEWAVEQGAQIVNLSLGGVDTPAVEPLEEAVNRLSAEKGTLFVVAAGNSGPGSRTVSSPGSAAAALTVGAVDHEDRIAEFSSRGPTQTGALKPDLTAPGVGIVAARHSDGRIGPPVADGYTALDGTSMATPHVAGAAALLRQQHPGLGGAALKARLTGSATPHERLTPFDQGTGRVDVAKLIKQNVTSAPTGISFGSHRWPHTGDPALTEEITYSNAGSEPVTLDLTTEANGDLFSVRPTRLTVPAGGTATATVTADVAKQPDGGVFGGAVVANGLRTAVVADLERESYDVTITGTDRTGAKASSTFAFLIDVGTGARVWPDSATGVARLAKGRYLLSGSVMSSGSTYTHDSISYPNLTVTGPTTIDLDARQARPVRLTLPVPARLSLLQTGFERVVGGTRYTIGTFSVGGAVDHLGLASLGPDSAEVTGKTATFWTAGRDFYGLAWYRAGSAPSGLTKTIAREDLAAVEVDMPALREGQTASIGHTSAPAGRADWGWGSLDELPPGPRTEYYGGEGGDWSRRVNLFDPTGNVGALVGPLKHYRPGRSYVEPLNRAVFGPALPETRDVPHTFRTGDFVRVTVPLYGDNAGNEGYGPVTGARTTLYRDNTEVVTTAEPGWALADVRPGAADYRLEVTATRDNPLSTEVSGVWTFRSDTTAERTALPLSVIRFTPQLDDDGYARAGQVLGVPVATQSQAGSVRVTSVEVSYDGGSTWRPTPIRANRVLLAHPRDAESVSLRAKASGDGQTVEQTIVNAYRLR